jgi:hypothetical protein
MNRVSRIAPAAAVRPTLGHRLVSAAVLLLGLLLTTPHECFPARQEIGPDVGISDLSCAVEPALRWPRQQYAGRDFIFTYGPLSQLVYGGLMARAPDDVASVMRFNHLLPAWITNIALWLVLTTTGAPLSWRAPAYLLWLLLWPYFYIKPLGGLLAVIICGYLLETGGPRRLIASWSLWALIGPVLTLLVFDLGVITGSALLLTVILALCFTIGGHGPAAVSARRRLIVAALAVLAGVGLLGLSSFVSNPFQSYLRDSWEIAKGYSQTMALPMEPRYFVVIALTILGSVVLGVYFGFRWRLAFTETPIMRGRALGLLAASCYCLLMTRYAMTRSDGGHVQGPVGTLVCLALCFLPCYLRGAHQAANWPAFLVWGTAAIAALWHFVDPIASQVAAIRKLELRPAVLDVTHPVIRDAIDTARQMPETNLYVWPYETIVGLVANKANPAYTLQAYAAHTPYLENKTTGRLQDMPDLPVLYFVNTYPMDDVEHLTRTPHIFRYLLENYALAQPRHQDYLVLRRAPGRKEQWREQELLRPNKDYLPGVSPPLKVEIPPEVAENCRASDLLVLRLSAHDNGLLPLAKPGNLFLMLSLSNGENRKQKIFVPPDGQIHDIIVSASNAREPAFLSFFHPRRVWRSLPQVVGLQLEWEPMDWLSRAPAKITLHGVSTLRRSGSEIRETSLAQAADPELWKWCYGDLNNAPPP